VKIWLLVLASLLLMSACNGGSDEVDLDPEACGFPTPSADADPDLVDPAFVLDGAIFMETSSGGGLIGAHLFVPVTVNGGFNEFRRILKEEGYKIVGQDNEGFEAEVYFRKGKALGAIQIRQSTCEGATSVFLNLPAADASAAQANKGAG
jgi:hypothetical protein